MADKSKVTPERNDKPRSVIRFLSGASVKKTAELIAYLIMLILVLVYFTGKGLFIYEGF
jgi:hypothetical protein